MEKYRKYDKYNKYNKYNRYRKALIAVCLMGVLAIPIVGYLEIYAKVPEILQIREGKEENIDLKVPVSGEVYVKEELVTTMAAPAKSVHVSLNHPITFTKASAGQYEMKLKIFGMIPLKNVDIRVIPEKTVIPAGIPVGIYVKTAGVMVIDIGEFRDSMGNLKSPAENILMPGDYIRQINDRDVTNKKEFMKQLEEVENREVILKVERNHEIFKVRINPEKNQEGTYKLGIWIRDSAQGIGTLTYVDADNKFGALGHGINDTDTTQLMEVTYGNLYNTEILEVQPGKIGTPGEITGFIEYKENQILGTIEKNTSNGIFGNCKETLLERAKGEPVSIGLKQDITEGKALMRCTVENETRCYEIEITKIDYTEENTNKAIQFVVTDPELLKKTGGVVQGMSGAPILQNGKLIGAVTHVLVNNPARGYGILMETMLAEEKS